MKKTNDILTRKVIVEKFPHVLLRRIVRKKYEHAILKQYELAQYYKEREFDFYRKNFGLSRAAVSSVSYGWDFFEMTDVDSKVNFRIQSVLSLLNE